MPTPLAVPVSTNDSSINPETDSPKSVQPAKLRPFRFEDHAVSSTKKFQIAGRKLKIAGLMIGGVIVVFGAVSLIRPKGVNAASTPLTVRNVEISTLKPISASASDNPASTAIAVQAAASAPEPASSSTKATIAEQPADLIDLKKKIPTPSPVQKSVVLPILERFQFAFLVKQIDEYQILLELNGKEYLVKPGGTLPDNETVFVGFDKTNSIMRTTAGDYRVFLK